MIDWRLSLKFLRFLDLWRIRLHVSGPIFNKILSIVQVSTKFPKNPQSNYLKSSLKHKRYQKKNYRIHLAPNQKTAIITLTNKKGNPFKSQTRHILPTNIGFINFYLKKYNKSSGFCWVTVDLIRLCNFYMKEFFFCTQSLVNFIV